MFLDLFVGHYDSLDYNALVKYMPILIVVQLILIVICSIWGFTCWLVTFYIIITYHYAAL